MAIGRPVPTVLECPRKRARCRVVSALGRLRKEESAAIPSVSPASDLKTTSREVNRDRERPRDGVIRQKSREHGQVQNVAATRVGEYAPGAYEPRSRRRLDDDTRCAVRVEIDVRSEA